jgi:hypothetical protein
MQTLQRHKSYLYQKNDLALPRYLQSRRYSFLTSKFSLIPHLPHFLSLCLCLSFSPPPHPLSWNLQFWEVWGQLLRPERLKEHRQGETPAVGNSYQATAS